MASDTATSITKPEIDSLLTKTQQNPFLLCTMASKRACDLKSMIRSQHLRVTSVNDIDTITTDISGRDLVSAAMKEINDGSLTYQKDEFDEELRNSNAVVEHNL
jgi:hypothetical protein